MILQYLSDEGYYASRAVVHDEANVKWKEREERGIEAKRLKQAILGSCSLHFFLPYLPAYLLTLVMKMVIGPKLKSLVQNQLLKITDRFSILFTNNSIWST
jgi:hypothetical protein